MTRCTSSRSSPELPDRKYIPENLALLVRYNKLAKDKNQLGNGRGKADWTSGYARWGPKSLEVKPAMSDEAMWRVAGAMSKQEIARQGKRGGGAKLSADELKKNKKKNIFGF